jgi:hypothetical protein
MKPTPEQIQIAKDLQRLGLCQGSKEWVTYLDPELWLSDNGYQRGTGKMMMLQEDDPEYPYQKNIGPFPTAIECWTEMLRSAAEKHDWEGQYAVDACLMLVKQEFFQMRVYDDLDKAYQRALITLVELAERKNNHPRSK